ncbi:zinc finger CCHC domain-containing protein 2-like isoform X2 [Cylas formicarius]|uniref:zinc finger CCHC domain-containing protein 2-like isoform X2 n=1 Tax=Cylas formicarius TaxID=197179 RepID=UPI00295877C4|nr:zinc finger CCHC domain-containing protein 2-like isoform X2 [Cylas formicarius]
MVCKEEFIAWFKDLDSYKRIDIFCELINMCVPFELRFVGSYLEEIGKYSYQELKQQAFFANDLEKLDKDLMFKNQTLFEEAVRHRVLLNISLLKSRNYNVANWYCKKFLRTDYIEELVSKEKDDMVQNELLLLFTMASRHPAFTFDQKEFFSRILVQLCDIRDNRFKSAPYSYPPGFGYPTLQRKSLPPENTVPATFPMHPPGMPQLEFVSPLRTWPGIVCGAPESRQPPPPNSSPLVSRACSPNQSRGTSPLRTPRPNRAPAPPPSLPVLASPLVQPAVALAHAAPPLPVGPPPPPLMPLPVEPLQPPPASSHHQQPPHSPPELCNMKDEGNNKGTFLSWSTVAAGDVKRINGMRLPFPMGNVRSSVVDQMQSMTLDDTVHYHSNSSSNSSPHQTPPDTPSNCASTNSTPLGRGPLDKARSNGLPYAPLCDTTSPPPPAFNNFQTFATLPPNRSMFHYTTTSAYRPPVTGFAQYPYPSCAAADTTPFPTYSFPYFSLMYSSYPPLPQQQPAGAATPQLRSPPGCYNCGAPGHLGPDCSQQNIEEITQKKTYRLRYSPVQSDSGDK